MDRQQKHTFVTDLQTRLQDAQALVVTHYRGLTVAEMQTLRRQMRDAGGEVQVAKNRLAKLAVKDLPLNAATEFMTGPTALAFSADPVAAAKVAQQFADKNDKLIIVGGALNEKTLSAADIKALSKLPSLDELRGKLVGLLQAPAQRLATVTQAPAGQVARVIQAKANKGE